MLEHVNDPELFLKEVKRIMKKDGKFIVSTPTKRSFLPLITDFLHKRWGHVTNGFEIDELRKLFRQAEFEIEAVDRFWFLIAKIGYLLHFMSSELFTKICEIDNRFKIGEGFEQVVIARKMS